MDEVDQALGENGALAQFLNGFRPRSGQIQLARQVTQALDDGATLIAEAGTGIGKTFAYLVPALLSGKNVLISTGTRHLQDQIFHSDIPRLAEALGLPCRAELLKGRSNYLCRLRQAQAQPYDGAEAEKLHQIKLWSTQTSSGDLAELSSLRDQDPIRAKITSTNENCLGAQCPEYEECFVVRARARAQDAQLVVVNHHLLCADLALKDDGFGELLPEMDAVVIDEAHQFADVLAQFFGFGLSARQSRELGKDIVAAADVFGDMPVLKDLAATLVDGIAQLQSCFPFSRQRLEMSDLEGDQEFTAALDRIAASLDQLQGVLAEQAGRGPELANVWRRTATLLSRLRRWRDGDADELVRWAERQVAGFALQAIPLDVAPAMDIARGRQPGAWILTSATLSVAGEFRHFIERLGLADARTLEIDSPFDYARNARLLLPRDLAEPNERHYSQQLIQLGKSLIDASQGGCFWLCTSQRAVEEYAYALRQWGEYLVLEQGQQERSRLLEDFRRDAHAILVGTSSFWEGVDVRGGALRLVIIDRLPFASPDDPVLKARAAQLKSEGRNPFFEHQIPQAVLTLKQGAGRLIRDMDDKGVLVLGDARVRKKRYGQSFLDSLPPMSQIDSTEQACAFLREIRP